MNYADIPVKWLSPEQANFERLEIHNTSASEAETKVVRFFHIDAIYSFVSQEDGLQLTAIRSGDHEYATECTIDEVTQELTRERP